MNDDEIAAAFADIVADIVVDEAVVDDLDTPTLDAVMDWRINDGHLEVVSRLPVVIMLTGFVRAVRAAPPTVPADPDGDDPTDRSVLEHRDELTSSTERALDAAEDLLTGGIPMSACFDAARGLQQVRIRLLATDEPFASGDPAADDLIDQLMSIVGGLAEDLLNLALRHD